MFFSEEFHFLEVSYLESLKPSLGQSEKGWYPLGHAISEPIIVVEY